LIFFPAACYEELKARRCQDGQNPTALRTGYLPRTSQKPCRLKQLAGFEVGTVRHDPLLEYALTRGHE